MGMNRVSKQVTKPFSRTWVSITLARRDGAAGLNSVLPIPYKASEGEGGNLQLTAWQEGKERFFFPAQLRDFYPGNFLSGYWETWWEAQPEVRCAWVGGSEKWERGRAVHLPLVLPGSTLCFIQKFISFFSTLESVYQLQTNKLITFIKTETWWWWWW